MKHYHIHSPDDFQSMPWRNGLGHTIEIRTGYRPQSNQFAWRLSMADVVSDGQFSDFSGYDRTLLLLQGQGMTLDHSSGNCDKLVKRLQAAHFRGDEETHATLHDGPIKDFNIMSQRDYCSTTVYALKSADRDEFMINADVLMIYAPDRAISIQSETLKTVTIEGEHLFLLDNPVDEKCRVSGKSLIVVQIHYKGSPV
jgi:uncharacterized protein